MDVGSVHVAPAAVHAVGKSTCKAKVNLLISMDLASKDDGFNAGSINFALTDRRIQAVLTTRRLVQLHPKQVNNPIIPWELEHVMEYYTDAKTEDLLLILYRHFRDKDSAAYYGFDANKLKKISNQAFEELLKQAIELPAPKATVDDVMDLFNTARKIHRRVLWTGHGGLDTTIAGMTTEDFLKAHQRLNGLCPQIEAIVSCVVGGKHRLALARISHEHPVILVGSDDLVSFDAFIKPFTTICSNLDKHPDQKHTVADIQSLMKGYQRQYSFSVHDEPLVILPLQRGVRLIDPMGKFIIVTADSNVLDVPQNKWAALYTTYIAQRVTCEHVTADNGLFYSQIAGEAHHLFEEVQLPQITFDAFRKSLIRFWIPSMRVKAFFIKKLSLKDRQLENVILTNVNGATHFIYRLIQNQVAHYYLNCDGEETQEIDPFTYFCMALEILKDSQPSAEAVRLATGGSEESSVYQRIKRNFLETHAQFRPYQHLFQYFDAPHPSQEIGELSPEERAKLLTLAKKYDCQPLILALQNNESGCSIC